MSRLALASLLLFALNANAEVNFKDAQFSLHLDGDWTQVPCACKDADFQFSSKSRNVQFTGWSLAINSKSEHFETLAKRFMEKGMDKERADNPSGLVTITSSSISKINGGVQANYSGRDSTKRSFRFAALIFANKVIYLHFETPTSFESQLEPAVQSVLRAMQY